MTATRWSGWRRSCTLEPRNAGRQTRLKALFSEPGGPHTREVRPPLVSVLVPAGDGPGQPCGGRVCGDVSSSLSRFQDKLVHFLTRKGSNFAIAHKPVDKPAPAAVGTGATLHRRKENSSHVFFLHALVPKYSFGGHAGVSGRRLSDSWWEWESVCPRPGRFQAMPPSQCRPA